MYLNSNAATSSRIPTLRVNTYSLTLGSSYRSVGSSSPSRAGNYRNPPLYHLPAFLDSPGPSSTMSRARPGGLAGIAVGLVVVERSQQVNSWRT